MAVNNFKYHDIEGPHPQRTLNDVLRNAVIFGHNEQWLFDFIYILYMFHISACETQRTCNL